jgi:thiol-disulfide isomerase/thioredoxin
MINWRRSVCAAVVAALMLSACGRPDPVGQAGASAASPFRACPASRPSSASGTGGSPLLPDIALPCFTGGAQVRLAHLGVPAIINFWASTCAPCRKELPELQRFADRTQGRVTVVGVVTADRREAAESAGIDFGVSFPAVFDPDRRLLSALGRNALPVTVFVAADGTVQHIDVSGALSLSTVDLLAARYLGVAT